MRCPILVLTGGLDLCPLAPLIPLLERMIRKQVVISTTVSSHLTFLACLNCFFPELIHRKKKQILRMCHHVDQRNLRNFKDIIFLKNYRQLFFYFMNLPLYFYQYICCWSRFWFLFQGNHGTRSGLNQRVSQRTLLVSVNVCFLLDVFFRKI